MKMKFVYYLTLLSLLIIGCGEKEQKTESNKIDLDSARHNIIVAINNFNEAYAKKDWDRMKKLLSGTVHMFGTDSADVINSISDYETELRYDWQNFDQAKFSTPGNLFIEVDKDGELANAIYEILFNTVSNGKSTQNTLRFSNTYKKESGEWKLVHLLVQMATSGRSSANLIKKK